METPAATAVRHGLRPSPIFVTVSARPPSRSYRRVDQLLRSTHQACAGESRGLALATIAAVCPFGRS